MKLRNLIAVATICASSGAFAATNVSYTASSAPSANPDANAGSVNVWTTTATTGDGNQAGFFQGNSADNGGAAGAGSSAWATYANTNQQTFSSHTFAGGALNVGQTVSLQFDNGDIATDKSTGIQLYNGATLLFQLYVRGGQTIYEFYDNLGGGTFDQDTTAGFSKDGGTFSFTLNSSTGYSATWGNATPWTGSIQNLSIDRIQVYNNSAGSGGGNDVYFNNLTVVPEPSAALLGGLGALALLRRRRI